MSKLNTLFPNKKTALPTPDGRNYAGGLAYDRGLEEKTLQVLCTGVFEQTFYASQKDLVTQAVGLFQQMALADAELFAKMIVYARNKGFMRIAPITALVVLSTADLTNFELAFPLVIRTPGDLQDFVQIVRSGNLRKGCGKAVKRVVNRWMNNLSEYHAIKYGSKGSGFSLRDILRLTHPIPESAKANALFSYLCNGLTEENAGTIKAQLNQVKCIELLKEETDPTRQQELIAEGRLPYEVVVGAIKPDVGLWTELMKQMPFFALLRHLNTLHKAGVFNSSENVAYVVSRLTDPKQIRGSKVLPFRFFTAYQTLDNLIPQRIKEALVTALEVSFQNVPVLAGRTAVGLDTSGSMWTRLSPKSDTQAIDIGAIFTAAMLKTTEDALILPFDTKLHVIRQSRSDSLMTLSEQLSKLGGGGTDISIPISYLLDKKIKVDTFVGITDNMDWAGEAWWTPSFLSRWREYKRTVNPNAKAFLLHVMPYPYAVAPKSEPGCYFFYGWSDTILPLISMTVNGDMTQLDAVRAMSLTSTVTEGSDDSD